MWNHFASLQLPHAPPPQSQRRYSVTADILSYQTCSLQYGAFTSRKYEPALVVQLFYGTVIHQVLDRAHAHYKGLLAAPAKSLPTDSDIDLYFTQVESALIARKIRAVDKVRQQAKDIIKRFNALEGPTLYPRIVDTECHLQASQQDYILHGNVDVLVSAGADVEIWDYKGAEKPPMGSDDYNRYVFQMQVYAELYRQKKGHAPTKAVLYFLNELGGQYAPTVRPPSALLEVNLDPVEVQKALAAFDQTVTDIEVCRANRAWPRPAVAPPQKTCDGCDIRWNCSAAAHFNRVYQLQYP